MITICLNPAIDLIGTTKEINIGKVNRIKTVGSYAAGKGIMVARVLSDLNVNVKVGGFLGEDNKNIYLDLFTEKNFENYFITLKGETRTNIKITSSDNKVTDLNFQGFYVDDNKWNQLIIKYRELLTTKWINDTYVVITGSLPEGVTLDQFKELILLFKSHNKKVVVDTSGPALNIAIECKPFLIKPNELEISEYFKTDISEVNDLIIAGEKIVKKGIENVIISRGEKGSIWINKHHIYQAIAPKVDKVISTVGAGDSMVAGLTYGISKNWDVRKIFTIASAIASDAVTQPNVGIKNFDNIIKLSQKVSFLEETLGEIHE